MVAPKCAQLEVDRQPSNRPRASHLLGTNVLASLPPPQKFLLPHLQPPTETALLASQQALEAKYDEAAALLTTLQTSTDGLVASVESQRSAVEVELVEVRKAVEEMKEGERARDEWARRVREQVDEVVKSLPAVRTPPLCSHEPALTRSATMQMLEKQSQSSSQSLTDLQTELKSLKSLLIARRPNSVPTPSSPTPSVSVPVPYLTATAPEGTLPPPTRTSSFTARPPGIPSWQLKGATPVVAPAPVVVPAPAVEAVAAASEDTSASGVLVQKEDAGPVVVDASV